MIADLLLAALLTWTPLERLVPSLFAEKHRVLKEGTGPRPGPWSHEGFEFLKGIEDVILEAIETGKKVVFLKPAQIGGSEAILNVVAWAATYMPGPMLYMTSTDDVAKAFSRERLQFICETVEPITKKVLPGRTEIYTKRFVDGKIELSGGRSVFALQSNPYRCVFVDEADSLADELAGAGDPIKMAELRTAAYSLFSSTLLVAFAHPSTKDRGVGRIYYHDSDQRRAFVPCPHCGREFWLTWDHVKVLPRESQTPAAAERDPKAYHYVTPCCGVVLEDHERLAAAKQCVQRSTLLPEVARDKPWIGVHVSHLYTKPLRTLAKDWIEGIDSPSVRRVVVNKVLGDVYEEKEQETTVEVWRALALEKGSEGAYELGMVPEGVVGLTAGQDSNRRELHWSVWGWGFAPTDGGAQVLRGWLVDYGIVPGPAEADPDRATLHGEDLEPFDQVLYGRFWQSVDGKKQFRVVQGYHDAGWQPVAVYDFARRHPGLAIPSKGLATDEKSKDPPVAIKGGITYLEGDEVVKDPALRRADLNTYLLKLDFSGLAGKKFSDPNRVPRARLTLPHDVSLEFLEQLASEKLVVEKGRRVWKKTTHSNHFWDTAIMAYAAALNLAPLSSPPPAKLPEPARPDYDPWRPPGGGWSTGARGDSWPGR